MSLGDINLSLEPSNLTVSPGEAISLQIWARSGSPEEFDGAEIVLQWDTAVVTLDGHSDDDTSYRWSASGFPTASSFNNDWSDGNALYQCLVPIVGTPPQTDILITTLQFTASQNIGITTISIPTDGNTLVASSGLNVLGTTLGATITVGSGNNGGAPSNGDDNDDETQTDDSDDKVDSDDNNADETKNDTSSGEDSGENADDDNNPDTIIFAPFCGAGIMQSMIFCITGLAIISRYGRQV